MIHGRGRRTAMAVACLVCMALLLVQGVQSRKLLWTGQEERNPDSLGSSHDAAGTATTPEPCSGARGAGSTGADDECDTAKWAEVHADYIYTQDVNHP